MKRFALLLMVALSPVFAHADEANEPSAELKREADKIRNATSKEYDKLAGQLRERQKYVNPNARHNATVMAHIKNIQTQMEAIENKEMFVAPKFGKSIELGDIGRAEKIRPIGKKDASGVRGEIGTYKVLLKKVKTSKITGGIQGDEPMKVTGKTPEGEWILEPLTEEDIETIKSLLE